MTAPNGPILFNNSTGSDTAASGLGPSTAVSGTGASLDGTSTVDLSADTPDLSGVTAGDLLWVATSSGRQFSIIASVDDAADTVTCDDAFSVTESSRNWGIGGKRLTLDNPDSRNVVSDNKDDWIIELEHTGTNYSITSQMPTPASFFHLRGDGGATRPTLEATFNDYVFIIGSADALFENLIAINTNATKSASALFRSSAVSNVIVSIKNCRIGSTTSSERFWKVATSGTSSNRLYMVDTRIQSCVDIGLEHPAIHAERCVIDSCGSDGVNAAVSSEHTWLNCIFSNNTGEGLDLSTNSSDTVVIQGCIFYNNGGDGLQTTSFGAGLMLLSRCIFTENGAFGRQYSSDPVTSFEDWNAYWSNTSGATSGGTAGDNDITLTADPFVDAANGDFNVNDTAGGGQALRDTTLTMPG